MTDLPRPAPPLGLLRDRSFRWLLAGTFVSNLGNQFTLIALPWTVLQITGDPLQLGIVLALIGIPRALFILVGGAVVDRVSPSRVLMRSKQANALLLALLSLAIATGELPLPLLYALALGLGVAEAFGVPAASSILPQVVAPAQLPAANGLMMGQRQLSMFVGPVLAGLLVALVGTGATPAAAASPGLAMAFAVDAASFVLSAWMLVRVRATPVAAAGRRPVLAALAEGLRSFWLDRDLRAVLLYGAAVALFVTGPLQVALPVLASGHPALGAAALGSMLGAHGAGTLIGLVVAGARPRWRLGTLGLTVLALDAAVGLLLMPLGHVGGVAQGVALLLAIGALGGFVQVLVFSWIQQRVAPAMMGRAMGLFMFIFVGLAPLSGAATGALLRWLPVEALFTGTGAALTAIALGALSAPRMRRLGAATGSLADGPLPEPQR